MTAARGSLLVLALVLAACGSPEPEPVDASSTDASQRDASVPADASSIDAATPRDAAPPADDASSAADASTSDDDASTDLDASAPSTGSCDTRRVKCDSVPPACAEGEAPSVEGTCWGECIPATTCTCTSMEECPDVPGYSETCYSSGHCGPYL